MKDKSEGDPDSSSRDYFSLRLTGQLQLLYPPPQFSKRSEHLFLSVRCVQIITVIEIALLCPHRQVSIARLFFEASTLIFCLEIRPRQLLSTVCFFMFAACPVH